MSATEPAIDEDDRRLVAEAKTRIEEKMRRLRDIVPAVLDLSCRECVLPSSRGHTLADKDELMALSRDFGFRDLVVANFFDFPNVDVQFVQELASRGADRDGLFAFVADPRNTAGSAVEPSYGMRQVLDAGIPNIILDLVVAPGNLARQGRTPDQALLDIERGYRFMRERLPAESERRGRIYANIADFFDVWEEDTDHLLRVLKLLAEKAVGALLFEDTRGTHFPFQSAEIVKLLRRYAPAPRQILVHPHAANGLEDATAIEALLAGADGLWAALTPHAAQIGHASSLMLLSNLLRAGNPHVEALYRMPTLAATAERMWRLHTGEGIGRDQPVVGERAYRYIDPLFAQARKACDLAPERIGRTAGWRLTPAWSPPQTIARRLEELGYPPEITGDAELLRAMRRVMSDANVEGRHARFETPEEVAAALASAQRRLAMRNAS